MDEHCSDLLEIFFRPAVNRDWPQPATNRDRAATNGDHPAAVSRSSSDTIWICSRAVSICGRTISISCRAVSIFCRAVLISGRAVLICSRSEIECSVENSAAGGYMDAPHLKVVEKKRFNKDRQKDRQTDRRDRPDGHDGRTYRRTWQMDVRCIYNLPHMIIATI